MKVEVSVKVNNTHLFTAIATRVDLGPMNDTYALSVNDVLFRPLKSCAACGVPMLVRKIVDFVLVLGGDGEKKEWQ